MKFKELIKKCASIATNRTIRIRPLTLALSLKGRGKSILCAQHDMNLFSYSPIYLFTSNKTHPNPPLKREGTGFTLAEVLITLGIIGVVATLTLPTIIQDKQNRELQTRLKKAYSTLEQALLLYQAENGEPLRSSDLGNHTLKPILVKYINNMKDCHFGFDYYEKACIKNYNDPERDDKTYRNYTNTNYIPLRDFDDGQFILNDGMLVLLENEYPNSTFISIDINGYKKRPNRLGQDLFMFQLNEKGRLLPMGAKGTLHYNIFCSKTSTNAMNGAGCTIYALSDKDFFKNLPK